MFAAVGGMATPALIYTLINLGGGEPQGWAVPAATDIAFALGVLALLGRRVPVALKVFLTAVAVVDDLGAILIIAMFFTESLSSAALGTAALVLVGLAAVNRAGVRHPMPYPVLGALLWVAILKSGIHATVAGVLLALFIPAEKHLSPATALGRVRAAVALPFRPSTATLLPPDTVLHRVRHVCDAAESPLHRWEHALQPWVSFAIMPLFALANAGVVITDAGAGAADLTGPVSLGVALGLLLGNPVGITLLSWLAVRGGLCELPAGVTWLQLHAASWLAGIGFTMSLFIAGLALEGAALVSAKLSLLLASAAASVVGASLLSWACRSRAGSHERGRGYSPAITEATKSTVSAMSVR
jgi:NhaA family Na+:H+ antiporter